MRRSDLPNLTVDETALCEVADYYSRRNEIPGIREQILIIKRERRDQQKRQIASGC
jgi:hypothetical protein